MVTTAPSKSCAGVLMSVVLCCVVTLAWLSSGYALTNMDAASVSNVNGDIIMSPGNSSGAVCIPRLVVGSDISSNFSLFVDENGNAHISAGANGQVFINDQDVLQENKNLRQRVDELEKIFTGSIIGASGIDCEYSLSVLEGYSILKGDLDIGPECSAFDLRLEVLQRLENLTEIHGSLRIQNDHISFIPFKRLKIVRGLFFISSSPGFTTLGGFESLEKVGGDLRLDILQNLQTLGFLHVLRTVEGAVRIRDNPSLSTLFNETGNRSPVLSKIGALEIQNNDMLESLAGLDNVTQVSADYVTSGSLRGAVQITRNLRLQNLGALGRLQIIANNLWIYDNAALNTVALGSLTSIGGYLEIDNNDNLTTLNDSFLKLESVHGPYIKICANDALATIPSLMSDLATGKESHPKQCLRAGGTCCPGA